jgi:hypothetical protein
MNSGFRLVALNQCHHPLENQFNLSALDIFGTLLLPTRFIMQDIICPHCNKAFKVDEAGYADILKQVRNSEFDQELHERLELAEVKAQDVTIKKLTRGNPTMKAKFDELEG